MDGLREVAAQIGNPSGLLLDDEDGFELFYEVAVTGWLRVTADVQVIDPGETQKDWVTFGGVRVHTAF